MKPSKTRILISGAGIAGLTLAYWLDRHGFEPTLIEVAPRMRGGGYMIDFWGVGYDVVERMSLLSQVGAAHHEIPFVELVDERGKVHGRMRIRQIREMIGWRHFNLLRSDLERALYEEVEPRVPIRFSTSIASLRQSEDAVDVELSDGTTERFDLVVGADGLRSNTRRLVFGPDEDFERYLGYYVASYTVDDFTSRDVTGQDDCFELLTVPGKQVGLYGVGPNRLAAYFLFAQPSTLGRLGLEERKKKLAEAFEGVGWYLPPLIDRMERTDDFYFDAVSQVRMSSWSRGRVCLVGDACQCVSLISGQGSALAMAGAYVLAGELARGGGQHVEAFRRYEERMMPEIVSKQEKARRFARSFVPSSRVGIFVRDTFVDLMSMPFVAKYFIRSFLADELTLEDYARTRGDAPAHSHTAPVS